MGGINVTVTYNIITDLPEDIAVVVRNIGVQFLTSLIARSYAIGTALRYSHGRILCHGKGVFESAVFDITSRSF